MPSDLRFDLDWLCGSGSLTLENEDVHVWFARVDGLLPGLAKLHQTLSEAECSRADRLSFEDARQKMVISRGVLRMLLGKYTHCSPRSLQIETSAYGKPFLGEFGGPYFNVSHSGNLIAYAFSRSHPVGIDMEALRPVPNATKLAERYFFSSEAEKLLNLQGTEQERYFFDCWVHKEAYMKARGEGFALSLRSFEMNRPTYPVLSDSEHCQWFFSPLQPVPGYIGALVVADQEPQVKYWRIE